MSITTRTGDDGTTGLWSGERVYKDDPRVEAYGALDEMCAFLADAAHEASLESTKAALAAAQEASFRASAQLASTGASPIAPISGDDLDYLDGAIAGLESELSLSGFVKLGMTRASARIDVARTVARRAERRISSLARDADVADDVRRWINRLSDFLFLLARAEEAKEGRLRYVKSP
jgi:ATP:cob(I)alamin adenosyltransferase